MKLLIRVPGNCRPQDKSALESLFLGVPIICLKDFERKLQGHIGMIGGLQRPFKCSLDVFLKHVKGLVKAFKGFSKGLVKAL